MKSKTETGFGLLIELLVVCIVSSVLMAMAVPAYMRMQAAQQQVQARQQLRTVAQAEAVIAICQLTVGCTVSPGVANIVPAQPAITQFGYVLTFTNGACWMYTATPSTNFYSQYSYYTDCTGVLRYAMNNPTAASPVWPQ